MQTSSHSLGMLVRAILFDKKPEEVPTVRTKGIHSFVSHLGIIYTNTKEVQGPIWINRLIKLLTISAYV